MPTATPGYGTATTLTYTLNSLATDATQLVGRQSTILNNGTLLADDIFIGGKFVTHSVAPTVGKEIQVYCFASADDGTTYNAGAGAIDAGLTVTAVKKALMVPIKIIPTDASTSSVYAWGPIGVAQFFGGCLPKHFGFWTTQNTGQILNAAGNLMYYTAVQWQST